MKQLLINSALILVVACALVYAGDYLSLRYRIPHSRQQFGTVMVRRAWVIPTRSGKTDYAFDPPAPQECVNSMFPHLGDPPCWYLRRHPKQEINTGDR